MLGWALNLGFAGGTAAPPPIPATDTSIAGFVEVDAYHARATESDASNAGQVETDAL